MESVAMQGTEDQSIKLQRRRKWEHVPISCLSNTLLLAALPCQSPWSLQWALMPSVWIKWCTVSAVSRFRKECLSSCNKSYPYLRSSLSRRGACWRGGGSQLTEAKGSCQTSLGSGVPEQPWELRTRSQHPCVHAMDVGSRPWDFPDVKFYDTLK